MTQRWIHAPPGSHWGEFGPDDHRGRMNLVTPESGLDGHDEKLLNWIVDVKLACLLADNPAVELVVPKLQSPTPMRQPCLPLQKHCLFKNGIHLGELWHFTELAAWLRVHRRTRFLLTAPPLRLPGAVGSPATPIATA